MSASGCGVLPDVEVFVFGKHDRGGVFHGILGDFLAVHGQHTGAALAETWPSNLKSNTMVCFAGAQLRPFPRCPLEIEQVVEKHHLAATDPEFSLAQEQAVAAEAPTFRDDHTSAPPSGISISAVMV